MIKIGQRYIRTPEYQDETCFEGEYILAQSDSYKCLLISVEDGNRWVEAVKVDCVNDISPDEFEKICNYKKFVLKKV